ncbi:phosphotransferase [Elioraea sp. Yellowstone]|jgi:aminoglycoside/choline kinase family phosphotransferase|uniref:aminoglycoside phosphotransferase family protein n=1 Tax=Elioraea sp. Yellowstone TaxID=2592070 RepID=UPI001150659F|nr:phosphotransferase [Elioraea sp. Yellowstone]TQF76767.1 phosphotransferase [Elioraea sp. Yellowstone]
MTPAAFLAAHGFGAAERIPLPADASFRRYERLVGGPVPALLMLCPPGREPLLPFLRIAAHLRALGLSAPAVHFVDETDGLALIEDLGEDTFTALLARGADETALYGLAVEALAELHRHPPPDFLPAWDAEAMAAAAAATLLDWWWPAAFGAPPGDAVRASFRAAARETLAPFADDPPVLVHRDFHVDNLLRLDRPGPAACGLLDFQDAGLGHAAYDVTSLLEDARRDIDPGVRRAVLARYLDAARVADHARFLAACAAHGALRHARVAALWTRLARRDGKPHYLRHAPRTWRLLDRALAHPACAPLAAWFDDHVPREHRRAPEEHAA